MPSYNEIPAAGSPVDLDEVLLRFARPGQAWNAVGRPTPAALSLKRNEDGLSMYARDLLRYLQVAPGAILDDRPSAGLLAIACHELVARGSVVTHEPETPVVRAVDPAHVVATRPMSKPAWIAFRSEVLDIAEVVIEPDPHRTTTPETGNS